VRQHIDGERNREIRFRNLARRDDNLFVRGVRCMRRQTSKARDAAYGWYACPGYREAA
jgi:hypothetical protein